MANETPGRGFHHFEADPKPWPKEPCPRCGFKIPFDFELCPRCGHYIPTAVRAEWRLKLEL